MTTRFVLCALLSVALTACGAITGQPSPQAPEPELPPIADLAGFTVKPQDVASLPRGERGSPYNAIPACDLVDWPHVYDVVGSQFKYQEDYDAPHEARFCSAMSAGHSAGEVFLAGARVDRPGPAPLFEGFKEEADRVRIREPYRGSTPGVVQECFWLHHPRDDGKNTGMVCRDIGNVTVHFVIAHGVSKADSVKLMSVMIGRARAYFDAYHR
jgi:hypothetical protein